MFYVPKPKDDMAETEEVICSDEEPNSASVNEFFVIKMSDFKEDHEEEENRVVLIESIEECVVEKEAEKVEEAEEEEYYSFISLQNPSHMKGNEVSIFENSQKKDDKVTASSDQVTFIYTQLA